MEPGLVVKASQRLVCLSLVCVLYLACPGDTTPPVVEPPQVTLVVPESSVAGLSLKVTISVSGCSQVQQVELYDRDTLLKSVGITVNPTEVELAANELRYTQGIAARMSLKARVVCLDGRSNTSQPQPATFFPVGFVKEAPADTSRQVVPDFFVAEGRDASVAFLGCGMDSSGRSWLYRVLPTGDVTPPPVELPFACTPQTSISDRHAGSGKRWLWTPNVGAVAFDSQLRLSGLTTLEVDLLMVGPDGDAVVWDAGRDATPRTLRRVDHTAQAPNTYKWTMDGSLESIPGFLIAPPHIRDANTLMVPLWAPVAGEAKVRLLVGELEYGSAPGQGGQWRNQYKIEERPAQVLTLPQAPAVAFDATGTLLYVGSAQAAGSPYFIKACAANSSVSEGSCTGVNLKWNSPDLPALPLLMTPYATGARLAVVTLQHVWSLNANTGAIANKNQVPLGADGALRVGFVQPGPGSDFYLLNAPVPTQSQPHTYPVQIVATDAAELGELYRYEVPSSSLWGALDDSGTLWMRVGRKLVRTLPLSEYRAALNAHPQH